MVRLRLETMSFGPLRKEFGFVKAHQVRSQAVSVHVEGSKIFRHAERWQCMKNGNRGIQHQGQIGSTRSQSNLKSLKEAGKEIAMSSVMSCKIGFEKHLSCKTYVLKS